MYEKRPPNYHEAGDFHGDAPAGWDEAGKWGEMQLAVVGQGDRSGRPGVGSLASRSLASRSLASWSPEGWWPVAAAGLAVIASAASTYYRR